MIVLIPLLCLLLGLSIVWFKWIKPAIEHRPTIKEYYSEDGRNK